MSGLERAIPKNKGAEFGSLLHQLVPSWWLALFSSVHKILLEVSPDAKDRLPKRHPKKPSRPAERPPAAPAAKAAPAGAKKPETNAKGTEEIKKKSIAKASAMSKKAKTVRQKEVGSREARQAQAAVARMPAVALLALSRAQWKPQPLPDRISSPHRTNCQPCQTLGCGLRLSIPAEPRASGCPLRSDFVPAGDVRRCWTLVLPLVAALLALAPLAGRVRGDEFENAPLPLEEKTPRSERQRNHIEALSLFVRRPARRAERSPGRGPAAVRASLAVRARRITDRPAGHPPGLQPGPAQRSGQVCAACG